MSLLRKLGAYILFTKPVVTASVYYTWLIVYLVSLRGALDPLKLLLESLVVILGISLGNALNNYIDRDIDSIMRRTRTRRPLARGDLTLSEARRLCVALGIISGITTLIESLIFRDPVTPVLYGVALLTYVYLYTALMKRRTWTSILVAAIAYLCVLLHAWWCGSGVIDLPGIVISLVGYSWVLLHLWTIALHWAEDYALADVPTISVRYWRKPAVPAIALMLAATMTCILAVLPPFFGVVSKYYIYAALMVLISEVLLVARILRIDWRTNKKITYICYKLTYPTLALLVTVLLIFKIV